MTRTRDHLALGLALDPAGHHPGAWRLPSFDLAAVTDAQHYIALGQAAQDAGLDFLLAGYPVRSGAEGVQLEPLSLAAALMISLRKIGLAAAVPMSYWEPFNVARAFAALDNLSAGRAAWLAVPASDPADEANFPRFAQQHITAPYERAAEFVQLTKALWDSWDDDALVFDKARAVFTERDRVHRIGFEGRFFYSDGPLNAPRPVQGHPPILVGDATAPGLAFAGANADVALMHEAMPEGAIEMRARMPSNGSAPRAMADLHFLLAPSEARARERRAQLDALAPAAASGLDFCGTAMGLAALMADWFGRGACDGFILLPAAMPDDLTAFCSDVVPLLAAQGLRAPGYRATLREQLGLPRPAARSADR